MRYAVVSDLHANLQAWNAVLLDIRSSHVDRIICLGDMVGYGPNPAEVLKSAYANIDHFLLGNHDAVVCGKMDPSLFNDTAQELINWTKSQLGGNAVKFLKTLPLSIDGRTFRCAHGDLGQPEAFNYVIDPEDALASWAAVDEQLLFVGHTHQPAIFLLGPSGTPHVVPPQDFAVEEEKRYLINVGSTGQPRDGDARASYCIFDTEQSTVHWRRVPFDIDAYRESMLSAGLDPASSCFLRYDPRAKQPPLREMLNFSPAKTEQHCVRDAVAVQDLVLLKRSRNLWRNLSILVLVIVLTVAAAIGSLSWRHCTRALDLHESMLPTISAITAPPDVNLIELPAVATPKGVPISGWSVHLGDKRKQSVCVLRTGDHSSIALTSGTARDELRLAAPPLRVTPGMKILSAAMFSKSDDFRGSIALVVSLTKNVAGRLETIERFVNKEPNPNNRTADGWIAVQRTETMPADSSSIQYQIRGNFIGTVTIRGPRLEKR